MIYFISDIHLGFFPRERDKEREELLIRLLRKISSDCRTLVIAGDLFDYWFEYKSVIPKNYIHTLAELLRMKEAGIEIEYLMGNHDFGHLDFFEKELGIPIHREDIQREYYGKKFYISHGDGKVKNDKGYLFVKKVVRHPLSNKIFRFFHPDFGIGLASSSSHQSRGYTDRKNFGHHDGMFEFAEEKIREGNDYVIMGHRHRIIFEEIAGGYYINLGEWIKNPQVGIFDGEKFELIPVIEFLNQ